MVSGFPGGDTALYTSHSAGAESSVTESDGDDVDLPTIVPGNNGAVPMAVPRMDLDDPDSVTESDSDSEVFPTAVSNRSFKEKDAFRDSTVMLSSF